MIMPADRHGLYIAFLILICYFLLMVSYYLFLAIVGFYQNRRRVVESEDEDYSILRNSHFMVPVSVIVPAHNEELWISDCVKALLNLNYPEYEVVIVNDSSTDRTQQILNDILELSSDDRHYVSAFIDGKVHEIFRSRKHPNVTVVTRSGHGRKAGAMNAGLGIARYKYICAIDADTMLEQNALLDVMAHVEKNPEEVVGVGSFFGLVNGFNIQEGRIIERSFSYNPIVAYQNIEYLRSFIGNRLSWSAFNAIPIISGGFGIWRRDLVVELGGYDPGFTCEDIEFTFRAYDHIAKNNKKYKILSLPYYVAWTEGPDTVRSLIIQRERWQRVTNETVWRYRHMLFNPRYKWFGFITFPYFVLYEVLGVFFEIVSIAIVLWAFLTGILDLKTFSAYIILMALSQTMISVLVLFIFLRGQKVFSVRYTIYLLLLGCCEFFLYRWILSIAKLIGTLRYIFGIRTFDQYRRTLR